MMMTRVLDEGGRVRGCEAVGRIPTMRVLAHSEYFDSIGHVSRFHQKLVFAGKLTDYYI